MIPNLTIWYHCSVMCSGVLLSPSVHGPFSFARRFSVCISHCSNEKPLKDHDLGSFQQATAGGAVAATPPPRPRRPKLRHFGPHRLTGRSPPPQPAAARGRRPPKRHNTSFKAQWARRSRSSIVGSAAQLTPNPSRRAQRNGGRCRHAALYQPVGHAATAAACLTSLPFT